MKLVPVCYYGFTGMDRRFSSPMLPWIVSEIRKRDFCEKLSLGVEDGVLQAYNQDFELQFSHRVSQMTRFSQADLDPTTFLYLLRDDNDQILYCYLFQAKKVSDVSELYKQMKEQTNATPTRSTSSAANLTSLCVDISPSLSNFFEVLYIGKIKVWHRKVPESFIDDALDKFKAHEMEKCRIKMLGSIGKLKSDDCLRRDSVGSTTSETSSVESLPTLTQLQRSSSSVSNLSMKGAFTETRQSESDEECVQNRSTSEESDATCQDSSEASADQCCQMKKSSCSNSETNLNLKMALDMEDHNRTMVLQVDRTDLRLISPDRKVILLHKHHKDVTSCIQGTSRADHFGFICKEGSSGTTFVGYVFKCESSSIASDAVSAITQAFSNPETRPRATITSCEQCPMVFFHKLCAEVEHLSDRKTQAAIFRRLEQLDEDEQNVILTKFRGAETDSVKEQNEFLMMLLRAHCEIKQGKHVHDSVESRSEFLNQYMGGGTIFMKAKRSLSNSFDQLLKRKSRDDFGPTLREMNLPLNRESSPASIAETGNSDKESEGSRSRSSTIGSHNDLKESQHLSVKDHLSKSSVSPDRSIPINSDKGPKSPMMDIFLKVGNSPKNSTNTAGTDASTIYEDNILQKSDAASWRKVIFKRVITPNKNEVQQESKQRTKEELRSLWRKSILQAILLVRMERENAKLKADQEESAVKRIKLEYDEMKPKQGDLIDVWEMITSKENRLKYDKNLLLNAVKQGVPRGKRGEVWQYLAEQYCVDTSPVDLNKHTNYNVPYETLLKQLTSHQHAILIDLGRTFPNHSYFSSPLGPGQLALFNLLKAYSLLDPEVGYCQGLSFVAGVLLLHMEESHAFFLLRHLMFRRGLRKQYLPDMNGLQIKLYQLSRLLHDKLPELYEHFDFYEVAPTLYAAPWLLTIFASQFPLGFVTRVFDLLFLESPDVVFRVALALLTCHKENLLACDSFEEIMKYMKNKLCTIDKPLLDKVMKQVFATDISKQLNEYLVEYNVLQEEMAAVQPQVDALHKLTQHNKTLTEQNKTLLARLEQALANQQRLEKTRTLQQSHVNRLEMQNRGLEVTVATLANFINNVIEQKGDVDIPDDVRRVMSQISFLERRRGEVKPQNNLLKMFQKSRGQDKVMVKSLSMGRINTASTYPPGELRSGSPNSQSSNDIKKCSDNSRTSPFFSHTHSHILQQRAYNQSASILSNAKVDVTIQEAENEMNTKNNNNNNNNDDYVSKNYENGNTESAETFRNNKTISLALNENNSGESQHNKVSPTNSIDSGIGTPGSPKNQDSHPLSNCDVNFSYGGTRELKHIRSLRNYTRNSSPDMLSK